MCPHFFGQKIRKSWNFSMEARNYWCIFFLLACQFGKLPPKLCQYLLKLAPPHFPVHLQSLTSLAYPLKKLTPTLRSTPTPLIHVHCITYNNSGHRNTIVYFFLHHLRQTLSRFIESRNVFWYRWWDVLSIKPHITFISIVWCVWSAINNFSINKNSFFLFFFLILKC